MPDEQPKAPFSCLWVVTINDLKKRIYSKRAPARALVTSSVSREVDRFVDDVELWTVSDSGWELVLSVKAGDHYSKIAWDTNVESRKRAEQLVEQRRSANRDLQDRKLYEELKKRFD